jgi:hypothetical protein
MPGGIIKPDRVIQHVREAVPALRVRRIGNNAIRLQESVDIRRTPRSARLSELQRRFSFILLLLTRQILRVLRYDSGTHPITAQS